MTSNVPADTIADIMGRHRALAVLEVLANEECNGAATSAALADVLDTVGLGCARTKLRACLDHLERSGLVTLTSSGNRTVIRLTEQGLDVAHGRDHAEGVQPPTPHEPA